MIFPFDNSYARLPAAFFEPVAPTPVRAPVMIRLNLELAAELGIDTTRLDSPEGLAILSGNQTPEGSDPVAMAYSGHQFGGFSPQLGDGRAILLGEVVGKDAIRRDIHLKGSGRTPFSRRGDGRSALGPVLREYLVSEAMAALGVPTTRALAAVASGEHVLREEGMIPGGVFTRIASSHIRIGTFQWFAARRDHENLRLLADHAIARHYPHLLEPENPGLSLLEEVIGRQASLIARWMQLGFIHGVMNTDNMSVSGETIDYGPCAFLDTYHPAKKFSFIDQQGRYAFGNQGNIARWNLTRLAETLLPLIHKDPETAVSLAETTLARFPDLYQSALRERIAAKIGLSGNSASWTLASSLLAAMAEGEADFTLTFRLLPKALESGDDSQLIALFNTPDAITPWLADWRGRMRDTDPDRALALMRRSNPIFIPRNHRIEQVIQAAYHGDYAPFHRLHEVLRNPFTEQPEHAAFEAPPTPGEIVQTTFCGT